MIKRFRVAWMATAFVLISAAPASAQVGHRVESLVVPGSAQSEQRKVPVHLWYPADAAAFATASPTVYTSALHGKPLPAQWDPLAWKIDARLARETSAVAASSAPYPVLVFSHGSVNDPIDYAFTLEQIARAGFVVAAPGHTNNTQDDVRIDYINTQAGQTLFPCNDGRPSPCSRTDNPRSMQDRVRDVSAILDAMPGWFGSRVDVAKAGVIGHSRGTVTALASAGGARSGEYGPDRRVQAIMGMAIGLRPLRDLADLSKITVPTLLVAGGLDRNSEQAISEEAIAAIPSADKRFVAIPNATHRSFDSTYCSQLQSAAAIAQSNSRAILDAHSVPLIAASAPGLVSGKAVHYCTASTFTTPVDIRPLIAATPNAEFPPVVGGTSVCSTTSIPCTGLDTDQVSDQMSALAVEFFRAKLARAAGAPVSATVPATLSLTLGAAASFGAFLPGVAREYTASTTANVTSSAGNATLAVADPAATGRLANGPISLPQPLQVSAGGPFTTVPATLRAWSAPTANDVVTLQFRQPIGANDALRTGTYSKTLTFTLSTTDP